MSRGAPRVTLRASDELLARLPAVATRRQRDVSSLARDLLEAALAPARVGDGHGAAPHTPDACAQVVLSHCAPDVQRQVSDAMPRGATRAPLAVLPGSLRLDESVDQRPGLVTANNRLRNEVTWTSQGDWELRRPFEVPEEVRAVRPAWGAL